MRCPTLFLMALPVLAALAIPALAETYLVNPEGTGDFPNIQAAVEAALDGDVIELTNGTFTGEGNRDIHFLGKAIILRSHSGDPQSCVIDCEGITDEPIRAFYFINEETALTTIEGITITHGRTFGNGGAVQCHSSEPTFMNVIFSDCIAGNGGAVEIANTHGWPAWGPSFEDCQFVGNSCDGPNGIGGAVFIQGLDAPADPTFVNCTFAHNWAGYGGALACDGTWEGSPTVSHCTFYANHAESGSGVYNAWVEPAASFANNIIAFGTGGVAFRQYGPELPTLACCNIYGNEGGDWVDEIADQLGVNGNISLHPRFCGPEEDDFHLAENSPCAPFTPPNEECDLIGAWPVGCGPMGISGESHAEVDRMLLRVSPNPFTRTVWFELRAPAALGRSAPWLGVYDATGRLVRPLHSAAHGSDVRSYTATWDGRDQERNHVGSGIYFIRLRVGEQRLTRSLMLLR